MIPAITNTTQSTKQRIMLQSIYHTSRTPLHMGFLGVVVNEGLTSLAPSHARCIPTYLIFHWCMESC